MAETVGPDIAAIQCYIPDGCCGPSPCDVTRDEFICQLRSLLPEGEIYNTTKIATAPASEASKGAITVGCVRVGCEQLIFGGCCPDDLICSVNEPVAPQLAVIDSYASVTYETILALCAMLKELDPCTADKTLKQWAERFGIEPCEPCAPMWSDKVLAFMICLLLQMRQRVVNLAYLEELARLFGAELAISFAGDINCGPLGWWTMARDFITCPHPSTVGEVMRLTPDCQPLPASINIVIRPDDIKTPDNCNLGRVSMTLPHDDELYRAFKCLLPKILPQPAWYCIYEENVADCISVDAIRNSPQPPPCIVAPPIITSSETVLNVEDTLLSFILAANEDVAWLIVGGVDAAQFEIYGGTTLRWIGNGTRDFEAPVDTDSNNAYQVQVRAINAAGLSADQGITVFVTNVNEIPWLTFENGILTNITTSAAYLAIEPTVGGTALAIASAGWKRSGKWYFEAVHTDVGVNGEGIGIAPEFAEIANVTDPVIAMNAIMVSNIDGRITARGFPIYPGASLGSVASVGDRICFAVDLDNWRFWAKRIGGGAPATTWDTSYKRATITLSDGNTKAEVTSGGGVLSMVRSVASRTTGKYYFEVACIGNMNANMSIGICNANQSINSYLGDSNNSISLNMAGTIFRNNASVGGVGRVIADGEIISVALDLNNNTIWFRVNGENWNNSPTANPATNAGGLSISAISGAKYVGWNGYTDFSGAPPEHDTCAANFGQNAFAYAVPQDFNSGYLSQVNYWNNDPAADPGANVGGIDISYYASTRLTPMGMFLTGSWGVGAKWTCNFGQFAFTGGVPSGFTPGWTLGTETAAGHPTWAYLTTVAG